MDSETFIEVLRAKQLSVDEYHSLTVGELISIEDGAGGFSRRQFFPLGETVLIRSESVDHIDFVDGVRYQVKYTDAVALMVVEGDRVQFRLQLLVESPIDSAKIKQHVIENDLVFFLSRIGFKVSGYEIQNRCSYLIDEDQDNKDLPIQMIRILDSEYFDAELRLREEPWPLCANTAIILFNREDHYFDPETVIQRLT